MIRCLGSDRGGEYISMEINHHLKKAGTIHHLTVHGSPQSNGTAERGNRMHVERARSMIIAAGLPKFLWAEAICHSVWIGARTPSHAFAEFIMPFKKATGCKPDLKGVLK